jgi:hypothetical protein
MTDDDLRAALRRLRDESGLHVELARLRDEVNNHTDSALRDLKSEILRTHLRGYGDCIAEYELANNRIDRLQSSQNHLEALFVRLLRCVEKLDQKLVVPSPEPNPPEDKLEKPAGFT